jgi:hypothetical protein
VKSTRFNVGKFDNWKLNPKIVSDQVAASTSSIVPAHEGHETPLSGEVVEFS